MQGSGRSRPFYLTISVLTDCSQSSRIAVSWCPSTFYIFFFTYGLACCSVLAPVSRLPARSPNGFDRTSIHYRLTYSSIMMSYSWNNTFVFFKRLATSDKCINPGRHNITSFNTHVVLLLYCAGAILHVCGSGVHPLILGFPG